MASKFISVDNGDILFLESSGDVDVGGDLDVSGDLTCAGFTSTGIDDNATSTALTLDSSQNATFAGKAFVNGASAVGSEELGVNGGTYISGKLTTMHPDADFLSNTTIQLNICSDVNNDGSDNDARLAFYTDGNSSTGTRKGTIAYDQGNDIFSLSYGNLGNYNINMTPSGNVIIGTTAQYGTEKLGVDGSIHAEAELTIKEITTPTAKANYGKIYTKTDNKLYFQDGAGTEHEIAFV